jgi:hypothetical protein
MSRMVVKCAICGADPVGRRTKPAQCIFVDPHRADKETPRYRCRQHLSELREAEIQQRERERGYPIR